VSFGSMKNILNKGKKCAILRKIEMYFQFLANFAEISVGTFFTLFQKKISFDIFAPKYHPNLKIWKKCVFSHLMACKDFSMRYGWCMMMLKIVLKTFKFST
jgi:hypothetical protein